MAQPTPQQLIALIKKLQARVKFLEAELEKAQSDAIRSQNTTGITVKQPTDKVVTKALSTPAVSPTAPTAQPAPTKPVQEEPKVAAAKPAPSTPSPPPRPEIGAPPPIPETYTLDDFDLPPAPLEEGESSNGDTLPGGLSKAPVPQPTDPSWPIEFSRPQGHVLHPINDPILVIPPNRAIPSFKQGEFLEHVLEGEDEQNADMMRRLYNKLFECTPEEKRDVYNRLTSSYWSLLQGMSQRIGKEDFSWPKRLFMRFGLIDPNLCSEELQRTVWLETSKPGTTGVYYIDEWLEAIYRKDMKYSDIDEMALDGAKPGKDPDGETCVKYEMINVPQMQRMVVGPRANLCAILTSDYCTPARDNPVLIRSYVYETLKYLKPYDYTIFQRKYKGEDIEVQPLVLILPGYGVRSACWEPWSPGKKTTGPRFLVCFFPPRASVRCLVDAMSDYRWEFAKAEAMHYWLTEGLTGKFLALFSTKEQRQDMKQLFRDYYRHYILNEPRRVPKLDKKFREWFFINIPYTDDVKAPLKQGGLFMRLVERELAKREREDKEKEELERIKAEREARIAARKAKQAME